MFWHDCGFVKISKVQNLKDKDKALQYVEKGLLIAPDDSQLISFKDIISKNDPKSPKKSPASKGK